MEMDKIIIVIFILVVMALVLYLCFRKKSCPPCLPCKPLQPWTWTDDQLTSSLKLVQSIIPPEYNTPKDKKLIECIVYELSRTMSFQYFMKYFMNQNKEQQLESILGIKGNWSNCVKKELTYLLAIKYPMSFPSSCISCIIDKMEQQYSPIDAKKLSVINRNNFMKLCESCPSGSF
jgi:hypothetical protein